MKTLAALALFSALFACGKKVRSQTEPDVKASSSSTIRLEQWSGRSDYIDTGWQVKSQP